MTELELVIQLIDGLVAEPEEQATAKAMLLQMGDIVVEPLVMTMLGSNGKKSRVAARLLGELLDPRALDPLFTALASPGPLLAWEALRSILKYPADETLVRLVETMTDFHLMTQQNIILAMRDQKSTRVVPALIKQMSQTESPTLRYAIIQTLAGLGDPQAIPAIQVFGNDPDHHVREWVIVALRQLSSAEQ